MCLIATLVTDKQKQAPTPLEPSFLPLPREKLNKTFLGLQNLQMLGSWHAKA